MLEKAFELAVVFSAVDKMTGPVAQMASSLGILDEKTKQTQARLNEFKNMTFIGGAITAAGVGLAKVMENGIDTAGKFLSTMTMIKDTTGATADQMAKIQKTIRDSSGSTIFGVQDTANYAKLLATSGMSGNQINSLLPLFTQYAEVQQLGKGSDPAESITQAIGAAHTVGAYDPKSLSAFLDKYNKATFMQPGSSSEFADTFKYLAPTGASLGMSSDDMLTLSALSNRVGLVGSMGGTNAADMILRSIPGLIGGKGKTPSAQLEALNNLGLNGKIFDQSGKFMGVTNFVEQLQKASAGKKPTELAKDYHDIFGMQGMRLADILSGPRGQEQLKALTGQMGNMKSIGKMQEDTNQTPEGQMLQLNTNMQNLKLDVWLELAKILNPIFMWLNKIVSKVQEFSNAHPWISKLAASFLTLMTAVSLIVGPLLILVGVLGYLKTAETIKRGFDMLKLAFSGLLSPTALIIAAIIGLGVWLVHLYNTNETFRSNVLAAWDAIYKWFQQFMPQIQVIGTAVFNTIKNVVMTVYSVFSGLLIPIIKALWDLVSPTFPLIASVISAAFKIVLQIVEAVALAFDKITSSIKTAVDWLVKWINTKPDPKTFQLTTSAKAGLSIGQNANGTDNWRGGLTWVGERGPELVNLPRGSQVVPNNKLGQALQGDSQQSQGDIHFGDINIYTQPGQSAEDIAQMVMKQIGRTMRKQSNSRSTLATQMW